MSQHKDKRTGKWYYTGKYTDITGKRRDYKKRGFDSKGLAKKAEELFLQKISGGYGRLRLDALWEIYLKESKRRKKASTLKGYKDLMDHHILPFFGEKYIDTITPIQISDWVDAKGKETKCIKNSINNITEKHYSFGTLKKMFVVLSAVMSYAVKRKLLDENPCQFIEWNRDPNALPTKRKSQENYLEPQEIKVLIDSIDDIFWKDLYKTLWLTGMRVGELCALNITDIDFDKHKLNINKTYSVAAGKITPPKGLLSIRAIDLQPKLESVLKRRIDIVKRMDGFNEKYFLFGDITYLIPNAINRQLERDIKAIDIKRITPHGFRHSHASYLINKSVPDYLIAERLGHTVKELHKTYSHIFDHTRHIMTEYLEIM